MFVKENEKVCSADNIKIRGRIVKVFDDNTVLVRISDTRAIRLDIDRIITIEDDKDDVLWELAKSGSIITREMLGIGKKREDEPPGIYYGI